MQIPAITRDYLADIGFEVEENPMVSYRGS
jgi:hypothetical protein